MYASRAMVRLHRAVVIASGITAFAACSDSRQQPGAGAPDASVEAGSDAAPACVPKGCLELGANCGKAPDGCGGIVSCGTCATGQTCGAAGRNLCGVGECWPQSCLSLEASCALLSDGCADVLECGECPAYFLCKVNAASAVCECNKSTCMDLAANCGKVPDHCGGVLDCGQCGEGKTCGAAGPNMCGVGECWPKTCLTAGASCGAVSDGCGAVLECGACQSPAVCGGAGLPGLCGCKPRTCEGAGVECGALDDGCGKTLECGSCAGKSICGGGGLEGRCGVEGGGSTKWAKRFGGSGDDRGLALAVGASGVLVITGGFEATVEFGPDPLTSAGLDDVFVATLESTGAPRSSKRLGGPGSDKGTGIAADGAGNWTVTGGFEGTADFGKGPVTSADSSDVFIASFGSSGTPRWSSHVGGTGQELGKSAAVDGSGNVAVTASITGGAGNPDIFLTSFHSNGGANWSKSFGGTSTKTANGVAADAIGNVTLTGSFAGTAAFGSQILTSAGKDDIFVTSIDSSVAGRWARGFGGVGADQGASVAVDASGNTVITGSFEETVDWGAGPLTSAGGKDVFVASLNPAGELRWSKRFGGAGPDQGSCVTVDAGGNVTITGSFEGTVDFGAGPLTSAGASDIFVAHFDSAGKTLWAKRFGGTGADHGYALGADGSSNVTITGDFQGTVDFRAGSLTSAGGSDVFVVQLAP